VSSDEAFGDLLRRARRGDQAAAAELVLRFEPEIRREVRLRLRDPRLRRDFDSMDICQSVLASFFVRAASGQYQLDRPDQLLKLLLTMTRNKLARQVRRSRARRRDDRRVEPIGPEMVESLTDGPSPSRLVAGAELLEAVHNRLSPAERVMVQRRSEGSDWSSIAAELGGTAEARRKQLARALDRVVQELGLDEA
jgi:RNA polymerase sigma-70 factor (ECF subfamily)